MARKYSYKYRGSFFALRTLTIEYKYFSYVKLLDKRFIGCAKTSLSER